MLPRGIRITKVAKISMCELSLAETTSKKGWVGFDLDSTLAKHGGEYKDGVIGEPIAAMIDRVKEYLALDVTCKIFTARVATDEGREKNIEAIETFCQDNFDKVLEVTSTKDMYMVRLYDDRAVQIEPDTGRIIEDAQ